LKLPNIVYLIGLVIGGLVFGCIADHSGRKMILLGKNFHSYLFGNFFYCLFKGSMWTACALSVFQLLSDDYISYVFFIFFIGIAIGAVQVITVPFVIEMVIRILILNIFKIDYFSFLLDRELFMVYY